MDKDDGGGANTAIKQLRVSPSDSQATLPSAGMADLAQAERVSDRFGCVALVFYAAISVFVFARSLLSDFANSYVGQGPDPSAFMWLLVWWPHAISHRLNPFLTHDIFEPGGFNLAWATSIPLASLLASPLTTAFGPVASFNVLTLLNQRSRPGRPSSCAATSRAVSGPRYWVGTSLASQPTCSARHLVGTRFW